MLSGQSRVTSSGAVSQKTEASKRVQMIIGARKWNVFSLEFVTFYYWRTTTPTTTAAAAAAEAMNEFPRLIAVAKHSQTLLFLLRQPTGHVESTRLRCL